MPSVERTIALIGVLACLAIAATGCGSSSDSSSSTASGSGDLTVGDVSDSNEAGDGGSSRSGSDSGSQSSGGDGSKSSDDASGGGGSDGVGGRGSSTSSGGPKKNDNGAPLGKNTAKSGDNSIQTYGTDETGPERDAAVAAMRSFVLAIADRDFPTVCGGLASKVRAGLSQSGKTCPEVLKELVIIPPAEARASANGTVTAVRVGGGNAFVLFRPAGSNAANYFVLTLEGGVWKSLGLSTGTPPALSAGAPGRIAMRGFCSWLAAFGLRSSALGGCGGGDEQTTTLANGQIVTTASGSTTPTPTGSPNTPRTRPSPKGREGSRGGSATARGRLAGAQGNLPPVHPTEARSALQRLGQGDRRGQGGMCR